MPTATGTQTSLPSTVPIHGRRKRQLTAAWFAALVCLAPSASSAAQADEPSTRREARELGAQGIKAYLSNDFATAGERLDQAYQLFQTPTLGLWSARALSRLGRWIGAAERYRETTQASPAVGDSAAQKQAQSDAARELSELEPRIPRLTIELRAAAPSEVSITLDGVSVAPDAIGSALPLDPGKHTIVATSPDERHERVVALQPGEHVSVSFELAESTTTRAAAPETAPEASQPSPPMAAALSAPAAAASLAPPPPPKLQYPERDGSILRPLSLVAMSVGAASLLASGAAVLVANAALDACPERDSVHRCPSDGTLKTYDRARMVTIVAFYAGVALVGTGVTAWFIAGSSRDSAPSLRLGAGLGGVWLAGSL